MITINFNEKDLKRVCKATYYRPGLTGKPQQIIKKESCPVCNKTIAITTSDTRASFIRLHMECINTINKLGRGI
ncbi:MAG: hypothetical protein ACOC56_03725 [Atribacterota bacterium]